MHPHIYIVGGGKGGVGKSMLAMALIDHLAKLGKKIILIESDTANPDVWKSYKDRVNTALCDLDDAEGWMNFVALCDENRECTLVVNAAARNTAGVQKYGDLLNSALEELQRKLTTFWVINRQRDTLEMLKMYTEKMSNSRVHVVRNLVFGKEHHFDLFNASKIKIAIESGGGKALNFPDLADRVADALYSERMSIEKASLEMPIGNRAELLRWRNEVAKMFDEVIK
jgi:short-subunit dehydrogenase involved in D-alanine esterification of teichoic acids